MIPLRVTNIVAVDEALADEEFEVGVVFSEAVAAFVAAVAGNKVEVSVINT